VACGEAPQPDTNGAEAPAENVAEEVEVKSTTGTGSVVAVDPDKGTVRLTHGPLPEVNWPGMTMTFDAKPEVLEGVAAGQEIEFDVAFRGGSGEVTAIRRK
jgi:Cu/Ag efflux protein CusF